VLARLVFSVVILLATISPAQNAPNRLLPVIVDGKHGFISSGGEIAIPARFEFAWGLSRRTGFSVDGGQTGFY
jgi:hypothetical protein